jgi:tripartite-type tricarboxylate transporter receptor subunit TctC
VTAILRQLAAVAASVLALLAASQAAQAQAFPSRPLRIVVPFGPGTGSDLLARTVGAKLSESLGQPVVIENREGAGGLIGARAVLSAPADGYTLMIAANPFVVSPLLYDTAPYDALKDFAPVARVTVVPNVLVVNIGVPARTAKELVAYAKSSPGTLNYASSGIGTPSQLETELLKSTLRIDILEVPYKSTAQAMTDVVGGQVSLYYPTLPAAMPHIKSGRLRALGVGSAQRVPQAPDIPTLAEALDLPGYEAHTWYGFVVRTGTATAVIARLNAEIDKAMRTADMQQRVAAMGGDIVAGSPEDFSRVMRGEAAKWSQLVKRLGLRLE